MHQICFGRLRLLVLWICTMNYLHTLSSKSHSRYLLHSFVLLECVRQLLRITVLSVQHCRYYPPKFPQYLTNVTTSILASTNMPATTRHPPIRTHTHRTQPSHHSPTPSSRPATSSSILSCKTPLTILLYTPVPRLLATSSATSSH